MTSEELKELIPMRQLLDQYGVAVNRAGMCCCPIHQERHPSMKVYKDSFNCFACGANGDIFTFVQLMDHCDFKTAFLSLGGTYEETTDRQKAIAQMKRNSAKNKPNTKNELKAVMIESFNLIQKSLEKDTPFSDRWCEAQNLLPVVSEWWELLQVGKEIDNLNVFRKCREFNQRFDSLRGYVAGDISN